MYVRKLLSRENLKLIDAFSQQINKNFILEI